MKEVFLTKFKDYDKELEKILEKKDFQIDAKNLILSMFYKLKTSYDDYCIVKRDVKTKQEYLENVLEYIRNCNTLELIKPNHPDFNAFKENNSYETDIKLRKIKAISNEVVLLSALLYLNDFEIHLKEEYNLIKTPMEYLLNVAYNMESIEVIRDFNAWSWNIVLEEIEDININLIYQNLRIALDEDILKIAEKDNIDIIKHMEQILYRLYGKEIAEKIMLLVYRLSIIICIVDNKQEKERLLKEKENIQFRLNEIGDKRLYIENIIIEKRKLTNELKQIDLILNNKELLKEEYERRNKNVAEYNRIFNISHLAEKLQMEREKTLGKLTLCNKKIDPNTYIENRNKLQKDYNLLNNIDFEKENNIYKYINVLQILFIKDIFINKIEQSINREKILKCMYEWRYYKFLPYSHNKIIKDVEILKEYIEDLELTLINKLYNSKVINVISNNRDIDFKIVRNIFNLKLINMEDIFIEVIESNKHYIIKIYDEEDTQEAEFEMNMELNKKDKIKLNKKIKLFT